jgi:Xaa-Pro aminopeptidase
LKAKGHSLEPIADNLVDALWSTREKPSNAEAFVHPLQYSGQAHVVKITQLRKALTKEGVDACVISALDEVACK